MSDAQREHRLEEAIRELAQLDPDEVEWSLVNEVKEKREKRDAHSNRTANHLGIGVNSSTHHKKESGSSEEFHVGALKLKILKPFAFTNRVNVGVALEGIALSPHAFMSELLAPEALIANALSPRAFISSVSD